MTTTPGAARLVALLRHRDTHPLPGLDCAACREIERVLTPETRAEGSGQ